MSEVEGAIVAAYSRWVISVMYNVLIEIQAKFCIKISSQFSKGEVVNRMSDLFKKPSIHIFKNIVCGDKLDLVIIENTVFSSHAKKYLLETL